MKFTAAETILHPETREILVQAGGSYTLHDIWAILCNFGVDNIKGVIVMN